MACSEAGGLSGVRRATILAHTQRCPRCGFWMAEVTQARVEILGLTPEAQLLQSQRAARQISALLRASLH